MYNIDLRGIESYTITESDTADHFIQLSISDSIKPEWLKGTQVNVGNYTGIVRQVTNSITAGEYRSTVVLGTKSVFLDTVIPGGYEIKDQTLDNSIKEVFSLPTINIDSNITALTVPLHAEQTTIGGKVEIAKWINSLTKIKGSRIYNAYFDLYNNFWLVPPDYIEETIILDNFNKYLNNINIDSTLYHNKPEAILKNDPDDPNTQPESGYKLILNKENKVEFKEYNIQRQARVAVSDIESGQYGNPIYWGSSLTIELSGEHDIGLRTKVLIQNIDGINGEYVVRRRIINKTPNSLTTNLTLANFEDINSQMIKARQAENS